MNLSVFHSNCKKNCLKINTYLSNIIVKGIVII
jgi:hypothetical protein